MVEVLFQDGKSIQKFSVFRFKDSFDLSLINMIRRLLISTVKPWRVQGFFLGSSNCYQNWENFDEITVKICENLKQVKLVQSEFSKPELFEIPISRLGELRLSDYLGKGKVEQDPVIATVKETDPNLKMKLLISNEPCEEDLLNFDGLEMRPLWKVLSAVESVSIEHYIDRYIMVLKTFESMDHVRLFLDCLERLRLDVSRLNEVGVNELTSSTKVTELGLSINSVSYLLTDGVETVEQLMSKYEEVNHKLSPQSRDLIVRLLRMLNVREKETS